MLARLPGVRAKHLLAALQKARFDVIRQNGSHITLHNPLTDKTVVVPMHPGEFPRWQTPYLGPVLGADTDWTPLTDRPGLFPEELDKRDPWQFKNVLVR